MPSEFTVDQVIDKLTSRFQPAEAASLQISYQFKLHDHEPFYIAIAQQQCQVGRGEHPDPSITLLMDSATFIRVVSGEQDGMSAFLKGQLRAEGDVMLATRLNKLFHRQ